MTAIARKRPLALDRVRSAHERVVARAALLAPLALFALRLVAARVFFMSGLTKWDGLSIVPTTYDLFIYEYFGDYGLPEWMFGILVPVAAIVEIILPVLLVLGLCARYAALGLFGMTMVIQLLVYPDAWWTVHAWWAAALFAIMVMGPGSWSLDRLIFGRG